MRLEYWQDLGKYLIDGSKVVLGVAVVVPVFEAGRLAADPKDVVIGAVVAVAMMVVGIWFKNFKK